MNHFKSSSNKKCFQYTNNNQSIFVFPVYRDNDELFIYIVFYSH